MARVQHTRQCSRKGSPCKQRHALQVQWHPRARSSLTHTHTHRLLGLERELEVQVVVRGCRARASSEQVTCSIYSQWLADTRSRPGPGKGKRAARRRTRPVKRAGSCSHTCAWEGGGAPSTVKRPGLPKGPGGGGAVPAVPPRATPCGPPTSLHPPAPGPPPPPPPPPPRATATLTTPGALVIHLVERAGQHDQLEPGAGDQAERDEPGEERALGAARALLRGKA
jgi:hypothetical protein